MVAVTEELEEVKEPPLQESVLHMEITLLPWSNRRGNRRWWRRRRRRRKRRNRRRMRKRRRKRRRKGGGCLDNGNKF